MGCCGTKISPNVAKPKPKVVVNTNEVIPQPKPKQLWGKS